VNRKTYISVIITAFNRSEFLSRAVRSVQQQITAKSNRELILVKNFSDAQVENQLAQINARSILLGNQNIGTYLATAIESSAGEVLVFLDDDDEFFPQKLDYVESIFSSDSDMGYSHNDRVIIDALGKEIDSGFREGQVKYIRKIGQLVIRKPILGSEANKLIKAAGYGYMSSIAVKKAILLPYLEHLHKIESLQDFFMYYCALLSASKLLITSEKFTKYRLHAKNVSVFRNQSEVELERNITDSLTREKNALETILDMASKAQAPSVVMKMIKNDLYSRKVNLDTVDEKITRRRIVADSINYFRFSFLSTLVDQITIFGRSMMYLISPRRTRRFFVRRFASR
jgi:glycosyltransferase involved in cell wall biosynthesis